MARISRAHAMTFCAAKVGGKWYAGARIYIAVEARISIRVQTSWCDQCLLISITLSCLNELHQRRLSTSPAVAQASTCLSSRTKEKRKLAK